MQVNLLPFNIDLLILKDDDVKNVRAVKVLDIFDGFSRNFHSDGLFSTETFGKVGEEKRNRMLSYIDLRTSIIHPIIFNTICELKGLYEEILSGKTYAIFNEETKDFEKSDIALGRTGYAFFLEKFKDLKFETNNSPKREFSIKLVNKYKDSMLINLLVVMPAGLRDFAIDASGKPTEDEINKKYREILAVSGVLENINTTKNIEYLDQTRYNLQRKVNDLFDYIKNLLEGKHKLILGKWASRNIYNSTRNVITAYIPDLTEMDGVRTVSSNQTVVGLYQFLKATLPLTVKNIRDTYLYKVFVGPNVPSVLVNKITLKKELVNLDPEMYDDWMTLEGLEKVLTRFGEENFRHDILETDNHYLGLIWKGEIEDKKVFKVFQDIDDVPDTIKSRENFKKEVFPLTFCELLYISVYKDSASIPGFVTRYPITGYGSVYPSYTYLKTTAKSEIRIELDDEWNLTENICGEFPITGSNFFNSVSPSLSHIGRLGADSIIGFN